MCTSWPSARRRVHGGVGGGRAADRSHVRASLPARPRMPGHPRGHTLSSACTPTVPPATHLPHPPAPTHPPATPPTHPPAHPRPHLRPMRYPQVEGIELDEAAMLLLGEIADDASLRHAVALMTPAAVLARTAGREQARPGGGGAGGGAGLGGGGRGLFHRRRDVSPLPPRERNSPLTARSPCPARSCRSRGGTWRRRALCSAMPSPRRGCC